MKHNKKGPKEGPYNLKYENQRNSAGTYLLAQAVEPLQPVISLLALRGISVKAQSAGAVPDGVVTPVPLSTVIVILPVLATVKVLQYCDAFVEQPALSASAGNPALVL